MKRYVRARRARSITLLFVALSSVANASELHHDNEISAEETRITNLLVGLPLTFEENRGQALRSFSHVARGDGYQIQLASSEIVLGLVGRSDAQDASSTLTARQVRIQFVGANSRAQASSEDKQPGTSNYFLGKNSRAITDVPHFGRIKFAGIYPGIDVVYYGKQQQLEFDLVVQAGADPGQLRLRFDPETKPALDSDGTVQLHTDIGVLKINPPVVYQDLPAGQHRINAAFELEDSIARMKLADYDPRHALIIDPVIAYSAIIRGTRNNVGRSITVDGSGNAYVVGYTTSPDFPVVSGAYDRSIGNSDTDAFVLKINPQGTALVYSTFLGGRTGVDYAGGVAVDAAGNAYVTGGTTAGDFPVSAGSYQPAASNGGSFVVKLAPAGNSLVYSTYIQNAVSRGIAVDASAQAIVVGDAASNFATKAGAYQVSSPNPSGRSAFVFKLNAQGTGAIYSTFLGGSSGDRANGVVVDQLSNAYVAGLTTSANFPSVNPVRNTLGGAQDGFVSKLNSSGSSLIYSTYLGGSDEDRATAIAVDVTGSAYITGATFSSDFPLANAFQPTKGGSGNYSNVFVTKLSPEGGAIVYSSYLGGGRSPFYKDGDEAFAIAVTQEGNAFVAGMAQSENFPRVDALWEPPVGEELDELPFIAKISVTGGSLLYSTLLTVDGCLFVGPDGLPVIGLFGLAAGADGNLYATGATCSDGPEDPNNPIPEFPRTVIFGSSYSNSSAVVALKLTTPPAVTVTLSTSVPQAEPSQPITWTGSAKYPDGTLPSGSLMFFRGTTLIGSAPLSNGTASTNATLPVGVHKLTAVYRASGTEGISPTLYQLVNSAAECN